MAAGASDPISLHSNQIGSINLQARMIESDMYTQSNYRRDSIQDVRRRRRMAAARIEAFKMIRTDPVY